MKKIKFKYISLALIIFMSALFFTPVSNVYASNRSYVLPYNEPMADENNGYIVVEYYNESVGYFTNTWMWSINIDTLGEGSQYQHDDVYARISINPDSFFLDLFGPVFSDISGFVSLYDSSNSYLIFETYGTGSYSTHTSQLHPSQGNTITGFYYKGNVNSLDTLIDSPEITVTFADNGATELNINEIIHQLLLLNQDTDELIQEIVKIYNKCDSISKAVNSIYAQVYTYFSRYNDSLDHIEELLETIESCVMEQSDIDRDSLLKGENQIQQGTQIMDEERGELTEEIPLDENGVPLDDMEENGNKIKNLIDQISGFNITNYTVILNIFTEHEQVTYMFVIALTFALVSFALFGRK